eukprot:10871881-Karenia_brevis.AAC.1
MVKCHRQEPSWQCIQGHCCQGIGRGLQMNTISALSVEPLDMIKSTFFTLAPSIGPVDTP